MRINLGCGLVYKKGFVNVDDFDVTVADHLMSAFNLEFEDKVAEVIECSQVLEHLGAAKSLYAVAECFRVLKPGGILLLETPDVETAFKSFLKKGDEQRKYLMNWIYGLDSPGMVHRYCFPKELLNRMLKQTGYENIHIRQLGKGSLQPTLRITCKKPEEPSLYQILARTRHTLVNDGIVDLNNQVITLEQETYLQTMIDWSSRFIEALDENQFKRMIIEIGVHVPQILHTFLKEGVEGQLFSSTQVTEATQVLQELIELDFPTILLHLFRELPATVGFQHQSIATIQRMGMKSIEKLLNAEKRVPILKELRLTKKEISTTASIPLFSETAIKMLADQQFALAAKSFALLKHSEAIMQFSEVLQLDRNNILIPWNLGRLSGVQGEIESAKVYFNQAENLAQQYTLTHRRLLIQRLKKELASIERGETEWINEPIFHPLTS
jgi:predicted SAM-dependent methyltransferase